MKTTKRIAASIAAMALALSMSTTVAFANTNPDPAVTQATVQIDAGNTNSYTGYQIFTGKFSDGALMNDGLAFGNGVNGDALLTALGVTPAAGATDNDKAVAALKALNGKTAKQVVEILKGTGILATGSTIANGTKLDLGYYYIEETKEETTKGDILKVADSDTLVITTKIGKPLIEKKIKEDDRSVTVGNNTFGYYPDGEKWNDAADYSIGESVPFKISVKMPEDIAEYEHYFLLLSDYLQKTFSSPTDYKYYVVNGETKTEITAPTVVAEEGAINHQTKFTWKDLKAAIPNDVTLDADSIIEVDYTATLLNTAVVGNSGNTNGVAMTYSTSHEYDGNGQQGPDFDTSNVDGVVAFTYTVTTDKTDEDGVALPGAKFKLLNSEKNKAAKVEEGKFVEWVDVAQGTELVSATNGDKAQFSVIGLDSGTYYLRETEAPENYNKLEEDVEVVVTATMNSDGSWSYVRNNGSTAFTKLEATYDTEAATTNAAAGTVEGAVKNSKGIKLPETGGIGTKIFYVGGGALAIAASVLLVTKKRAKN